MTTPTKTIEIEVTDLVTGFPHIIRADELQEMNGLSQASRIESIKFDNILVLNTNITDRSNTAIKELCELYLNHEAISLGFEFNAIIVAYLINKALTADKAHEFINNHMKLEIAESKLSGHKDSLLNLLKEKHPSVLDIADYVISNVGGLKYVFSLTHS